MERLALTVLLCLCLVPVVQCQDVDLSGVTFNPAPEPDCCQPSPEITQPIISGTSCEVKIRGCHLGCSRCSNHTGNIFLGSANAQQKVCPAESSIEEEVCCKPAQTERRYYYCTVDNNWYSYEYPITCECGPCEYLTTNSKCIAHELEQKIAFRFDIIRCITDERITRRRCRGSCVSYESHYVVQMFQPWWFSKPVYRKSCTCCEPASYQTLENVPVTCQAVDGFSFPLKLRVDIQIILTCECRYCSSKPWVAEDIEYYQSISEEPIDVTSLLTATSTPTSGTPASLNSMDVRLP